MLCKNILAWSHKNNYRIKRLMIMGMFFLTCITLLHMYLLHKNDWIPLNKMYVREHIQYKKGNIEHKGNETEPHYHVIHDFLDEVIGEREALKFGPCQDTNLSANPLKSSLKIIGSGGKNYQIGEKIYVMATLYDSYGRKKTSGGDHVRATISNSFVNASAPGVVFDHNNGSYTIIFEALWSGQSNISATLAYTREAITAMFRLMIEEECIRPIWARYKSQDFEEDAVCHPDQKRLLTAFKYNYICNFTDLVSGIPWYCGKPQDGHLECKHWMFVGIPPPEPDLPQSKSECDRILLATPRHVTSTLFLISLFSIRGTIE